MKRNATNFLLNKAKINKKDEFYTQLIDIERELIYYEKHLKDKIVFCNCDFLLQTAVGIFENTLLITLKDSASKK